MSYKILPTLDFIKEFKPLKKKYPSIQEEIDSQFQSLKENPFQGDPLGNDCYKIRVAVKSKGKGKSGGARLIIHVIVKNKEVYPLSIYDKSNQASISKEEIKQRIKALNQ